MLNEANFADARAELLGEPHTLVQRLGSPDDWASVPSSVSHRLESVTNISSLRRFLEFYRAEVLIKTELPSILRAFEHASRNEARELIEFDRALAKDPLFVELASASQRVGRAQLRRLRPLRDSRLVQRYLDAIDAGEAKGWHTLAYGIGLSLYSLPLRQGLNGYTQQTIGGFVHAATRQLRLPELEAKLIGEDLISRLPADTETCLSHPASTVALSPVVVRKSIKN